MKQYSRAGFLEAFMAGEYVEGTPQRTATDHKPVQKVRLSKLGIAPYKGTWGKAQVLHLLRRSLFGVSHADYKYFAGLTLQQCLDTLLTQSGPVDPPINNYSSAAHFDRDVPSGKTWVDHPIGTMAFNGIRIYSLKTWWAGLMLNQDRSLTEKMTLFWHNHFATQMLLVFDARYSYKHLVLLRSNALGNFKKLARAVTTDPAMLVYQNGNTNTAGAPNENYARELQELFTVGKGAGSHYTEGDVKAAARVLTGWKEDKNSITSGFDPNVHDTEDKKFSAFYNGTVIKGRNGADGAAETDDLIDMIFRQREVARYFCRKLYRWFVYYNINEDVEAKVISPLADILIANKFEVIPVLRALLGSEHFYDTINMGCVIKNPVDALIGECRTFNIAFPRPAEFRKLYLAWYLLYEKMSDMAMDIGDPPAVAGWPSYYQIPQYHELWINSSTLPARNGNSDKLCSPGGIYSDGVTLAFDDIGEKVYLRTDVLAFTSEFQEPGNINSFIDDSTALLCPNRFDAKQRGILKGILLSGKTEEHYWNDAWKDYTENPANKAAISVVTNRLIQYYSYIMDRAEYQLI